MNRVVTHSALLLASVFAANVSAEPRDEVRKAFDKVIDAGGFRGHVQGNVFGPGTPSVSGEIDVLFPNRIQLHSDELEFVVTPDGAWISALGFWAPADPSILPVTEFDMAGMRKAIASISDVSDEGGAKSAACADLRVFAFRASGQLPGTFADGKVRLWICQTDARPSRIEATDASNERMVIDFDWSRRPQVEAPGGL